MDAAAIAAAGTPVLCLDTCSLLDLMRDPTRETAQPHDRQAGFDLVAVAELGGLTCLMADQVALEFATHDQPVQAEAQRNLAKLRQQVDRVNRLSAVYGASATVRLEHLDDHVARARALVERWLAQTIRVTPSPDVPGRAFARINAARAPAAKGKDSSKDCLVYETYLEAMAALRAAGCAAPIVFLSSNTTEYLSPGGILKSDIEQDFAPLGVTYTATMGHAKHALGV